MYFKCIIGDAGLPRHTCFGKVGLREIYFIVKEVEKIGTEQEKRNHSSAS